MKIIDPAIQRLGRLSKSITFSVPDEQARRRIVEGELGDVLSADSLVNSVADVVSHISRKSVGKTGASIVAICNNVLLLLSKGAMLDENAITNLFTGE